MENLNRNDNSAAERALRTVSCCLSSHWEKVACEQDPHSIELPFAQFAEP